LLSQSGPGFILEKKASKKTMRILPAVLVVESVIGAASAALKPIETDTHPVNSKAAAVIKTSPRFENQPLFSARLERER
jgi:hypothetical protein